jgi:hypothetical protein
MQERKNRELTIDIEIERYVNSAAAARFLGVSIQTIKNWRKQNIGPVYTKLGRIVRYRVLDLMHFAEARRIDPQGPAPADAWKTGPIMDENR